MAWYAEHGRFLYPFEIKSIWEFVKNTTFDKKIVDKVAQETLKEDFLEKARNKNYHKDFGARSALSKFNTEYAWKLISFFSCEEDKIIDPFAGRTRQIICQELNRDYEGFEINPKYAREGIIIDDCVNIKSYFSPGVFDLMFTCPPYWNMEKYSKDIEGDLSRCISYRKFLKLCSKRLKLCVECVKNNGLIIIVVADFRYKNQFIPLHFDIINIVNEAGWSLYDLIILEMNPMSRRCFYAQAITKRRMLTTHEYCLVFHKDTIIADRKYKEDSVKRKGKNKVGLFSKSK